MRIALLSVITALALAGCEGTVASTEPVGTPQSVPSTGPVTCNDQRGEAEAVRLVERCRAVSPATRPPCHADNPCRLIEDEIARSCAGYDAGTAPAACAA